jgi:hypothetical protein
MRLVARFALEMAEAKNVLRHVAVAWNNAMKFARTGALQRLWAKTASECVAVKLLITQSKLLKAELKMIFINK